MIQDAKISFGTPSGTHDKHYSTVILRASDKDVRRISTFTTAANVAIHTRPKIGHQLLRHD